MLVCVDAPHFNAGIILDSKGFVERTAPILQWTKGKHFSELRPYFRRKGWQYCRASE